MILYNTTGISPESLRNFVHSCTVNCCGLLHFRTLEGQGFFMEPECTHSTSLTPPKILIYMLTHSNCAFCPSWLTQSRHCSLCLSLALFTVDWHISTGLWSEL